VCGHTRTHARTRAYARTDRRSGAAHWTKSEGASDSRSAHQHHRAIARIRAPYSRGSCTVQGYRDSSRCPLSSERIGILDFPLVPLPFDRRGDRRLVAMSRISLEILIAQRIDDESEDRSLNRSIESGKGTKIKRRSCLAFARIRRRDSWARENARYARGGGDRGKI